MINNIKNRIVSFAGIFICALCFIPKEVSAARIEIPPTDTQVSSQDENLLMMYFPYQINQVILAHMPRYPITNMMYEKLRIEQGCFRVDTPQGKSLTISSSTWFQIRIVEAQVEGQNHTFLAPVIEYRIEDVASPPKVVVEYPDSGDIQPTIPYDNTLPQSDLTEIQPTLIIPSEEFENLLVRCFPADVNNKILSFLKRNINDAFPYRISPYQSAEHNMVAVSDRGGEIIIPSPEGNIHISSSKWFRIRIMLTPVKGHQGLFYCPIVEYKVEDVENPPRMWR